MKLGKVARYLAEAISLFFDYNTHKIVVIKSKAIGILNRLIQLAILLYIVVWVIVWNKGYQEFSPVHSSVTTKVKGFVLTNFSHDEIRSSTPLIYNQLWDSVDFVLPPQDTDSFFVMTNIIITPNQTQGICPEEFDFEEKCKSDVDCPAGFSVETAHGPFTGKCNENFHRCEVYAWCPIERDYIFPLKNRPLLAGWENFTVLIKNNIEFPLWSIKTRNVIPATVNRSYLRECFYNAITDPLCPKFKLGTIIQHTGNNLQQIGMRGGVVAIIIQWECDLDYNIRHCLPRYEFRMLDDPFSDVGQGWNFRFAKYYDYGTRRDLYKAYGILFVLIVQGRGGKFSMIPLLLRLGSGLGLLSVAVVLCDIMVLHISKKRKHYKSKMREIVNGEQNN